MSWSVSDHRPTHRPADRERAPRHAPSSHPAVRRGRPTPCSARSRAISTPNSTASAGVRAGRHNTPKSAGGRLCSQIDDQCVGALELAGVAADDHLDSLTSCRYGVLRCLQRRRRRSMCRGGPIPRGGPPTTADVASPIRNARARALRRTRRRTRRRGSRPVRCERAGRVLQRPRLARRTRPSRRRGLRRARRATGSGSRSPRRTGRPRIGVPAEHVPAAAAGVAGHRDDSAGCRGSPRSSARRTRARRSSGRDAANASRCAVARSCTLRRVARSRITRKSHGWLSPTLGARCAASSTRPSVTSSTGRSRNPRRTSRRSAITRCTTSRSRTSYPAARCMPTATVASRGFRRFGMRSSAPVARTAASATLGVPAELLDLLARGRHLLLGELVVREGAQLCAQLTRPALAAPGSFSLPAISDDQSDVARRVRPGLSSRGPAVPRYDVPERRPTPRTRLTSPTPLDRAAATSRAGTSGVAVQCRCRYDAWTLGRAIPSTPPGRYQAGVTSPSRSTAVRWNSWPRTRRPSSKNAVAGRGDRRTVAEGQAAGHAGGRGEYAGHAGDRRVRGRGTAGRRIPRSPEDHAATSAATCLRSSTLAESASACSSGKPPPR